MKTLLAVVLAGCVGGDSSDVHGTVQVRVTRDELPVAGAHVIFHGTSGGVRDRAITDDAGEASGDGTFYGMVTVVDPDFEHRLVSVAQPRFDIPLEIPLTAVSLRGALIGTLTIDAPPGAAPPDTADYEILTPCTRDYAVTLPAVINLYARCGAEVPIVVTAKTAAPNLEYPGDALAYVHGIASGGRFTPGAWSTACTFVTPQTDPVMAIEMWPRLGGHTFRGLSVGFCGQPPISTAIPSLDFGEGALAHAWGYLDPALRAVSLLSDLPTVPETLAIEADSDLLVGDVALVAFAANGVQWSRDARLAATDVIVAELSWRPHRLEHVTWKLVLPGNAVGVALPSLPADVQAWDDLETALEVGVNLRYLDASWASSPHELLPALPLVIQGVDSPRTLPVQGALREYSEQLPL